MYRSLGTKKLTTGEEFAVVVVEAPDPAWTDRLGPFLHHKGPDYNDHIDRALRGRLDDLRTRFYVGCLDNQPVTHAMVADARGAGIFAHVYTAPAWRRRGAFGHVMTALMRDVRDTGPSRLVLTTGPDSVAFRIYEGFGFRPAVPGSGQMCWSIDDEPGDTYLDAGDAVVRPLRWGDWGPYNYVTVRPPHSREPLPRSPAVGVDERGNAEGALLQLLRCVDDDPRVEAHVLESHTGAVTGWCHVVPGRPPFGHARLLDLHVLPAFEGFVGALLGAVSWPDEPVLFVAADLPLGYRRALATAGFRATGSLGPVARDGRRADVEAWLRPDG